MVNNFCRKVSMAPQIMLSLWRILNIFKLGCQGVLESSPLHFAASGRKIDPISGGAGPESKDVARKNQEAGIISWAGRARRSFSKNRGNAV
jgi:hypothetical protein